MVGPMGIRGRYVVAGFAFRVPYVAQGAVLRKELGRDVPKIVRLLIGNPLIMKDMAKHVPDAGSYAPVTVLIDERSDGVHLSYDRVASFLKAYGTCESHRVAKDLDAKVKALLTVAAT